MPWTKCQMEPRPWRTWPNTGAGLLVVHSSTLQDIDAGEGTGSCNGSQEAQEEGG